MKIYFLLMGLTLAFTASNDTDNDADTEMKDPSTVHPPSEAIPDSTALLNDSVIVPDVTHGNGSQVSNSDSIQKQLQ